MSALSCVCVFRLLSVAIAAGPELPCASAVFEMIARGMRGGVTFSSHSFILPCIEPVIPFIALISFLKSPSLLLSAFPTIIIVIIITGA